MDYALRMHSKSSCLVSIGSQACRVSERRRNEGFKAVSFILVKNNLRNSMIISVLENWLQKNNENDDVVLVDKAKVVGNIPTQIFIFRYFYYIKKENSLKHNQNSWCGRVGFP